MESSFKPSIQVRAAVQQDLRRIFQIERSSPTAAHWSEADYEIALTNALPRRWLLVAEIEDQIEGFMVVRSAHPEELEIENIVVAASNRRRGVGLLLVNIFLEQARTQKVPGQPLIIHLEVRESNLAARRLYERSGFLLATRRVAYYRDPEEEALLYSLSLQ